MEGGGEIVINCLMIPDKFKLLSQKMERGKESHYEEKERLL